jgi:hypothetical protein
MKFVSLDLIFRNRDDLECIWGECFYSPSPQYPAACCRAERQGIPNRTTCLDGVLTKSEAHQSEGGLLLLYHFNVEMATAINSSIICTENCAH